jgi:hydrogenase maturation protein HypF
MGRLFDAVAALTGVKTTINYEGQAAIELEACCDPHERGHYQFTVTDGVIDPRPAIAAIAAASASPATERPASASPATKRPATASPATVAARFHNGLARATVAACTHAAETTATDTVVLSGGVFANRRLLDQVTTGLQDNGLRVLVPRRLPVNDGGISYGQAAIAAAQMAHP